MAVTITNAGGRRNKKTDRFLNLLAGDRPVVSADESGRLVPQPRHRIVAPVHRHRAPFGGSTAYGVLDTVVALRDGDARKITLQ